MPADIVDQAIKDAFTSLDRIIIDGGAEAAVGDRFLNDAMSELSPSYSGSCALVSNCLSKPCYCQSGPSNSRHVLVKLAVAL